LSNGETKTITINVTITEENITNESVEISLSATKPQIIQFNFENVTADFEPQISSGELHIEILFYDFNTMTIKPISKGTAVIVVNSGTAIKIYTITVID
ncbi:MAG: hypothetical protein IJX26_00080, partial [Clostridia bacterium]|nr:hypothetical protein [Clostridia bacterium]